MHYAIYEDVVSRWNARVFSAPPNAEFSLYEYYRYLLNVYDHLDALNRAVGAATLADIQHSWGSASTQDSDDAAAQAHEPLAWIAYRDRIRWMLAGFYADRVS